MKKMSRYFVVLMAVVVVLTTQSYSSVYADEVITVDEHVIETEDTDVTGPGEIADDEDSTEEDTVNIPDEDEIRSEMTEEAGDIDADYEDTPDDGSLDADGVAAGQYSFGTDWSQWSQAYFYDATVKKNACRIIAYSKMMVQAGAIPMSDVTSGRFNPGVFYDWCAGNGWFSDGIITEKGSSGDCAKAFAKNIYGVTLYMTSNSVSGWSDGDKINKAMEGVNAFLGFVRGGIGFSEYFILSATGGCVDGGFLYWGNTANMEAMAIGGIIIENNPLILELHLQTVCIQQLEATLALSFSG